MLSNRLKESPHPSCFNKVKYIKYSSHRIYARVLSYVSYQNRYFIFLVSKAHFDGEMLRDPMPQFFSFIYNSVFSQCTGFPHVVKVFHLSVHPGNSLLSTISMFGGTETPGILQNILNHLLLG